MKILFLLDMKGQLGDMIRVARIYDKLKASGAGVSVVNLQTFHRPRARLLANPWLLMRLATSTLAHYHLGKYHVQAKLCQLVVEKKIRELRPDVIWCETIFLAGAIAELCRQHGLPLITDVHGLGSAEYGENKFHQPIPARCAYFHDMEQRAIDGSTVLITVSTPMSEYLLRHGARPEQLVCIPNGAELQPKRARYQDPLKVIFGGAFVFWEDIDAFLDAAHVARRHQFYLAGSGYLEDHLTSRIEQENIDINYLGSVRRDKIMDMFAEMQVGLAPSVAGVTRRVACPIKVFDYLSCGLPVITPDVGEWATVIKAHRCGVVTARSTGEQFAQALEQLSDRPTWEEMSHNAVALIQHTWNWDRLLEPVPRLLNQL